MKKSSILLALFVLSIGVYTTLQAQEDPFRKRVDDILLESPEKANLLAQKGKNRQDLVNILSQNVTSTDVRHEAAIKISQFEEIVGPLNDDDKRTITLVVRNLITTNAQVHGGGILVPTPQKSNPRKRGEVTPAQKKKDEKKRHHTKKTGAEAIPSVNSSVNTTLTPQVSALSAVAVAQQAGLVQIPLVPQASRAVQPAAESVVSPIPQVSVSSTAQQNAPPVLQSNMQHPQTTPASAPIQWVPAAPQRPHVTQAVTKPPSTAVSSSSNKAEKSKKPAPLSLPPLRAPAAESGVKPTGTRSNPTSPIIGPDVRKVPASTSGSPAQTPSDTSQNVPPAAPAKPTPAPSPRQANKGGGSWLIKTAIGGTIVGTIAYLLYKHYGVSPKTLVTPRPPQAV